jgi:hypothetical protein
MRREKTQISKIRNKKGEITKIPMKSKKSSGTTLRTYIQIEEMDKFLDTYDHQKLNQNDINHLNRYI